MSLLSTWLDDNRNESTAGWRSVRKLNVDCKWKHVDKHMVNADNGFFSVALT